ncbi:hypothetical protein M1P56_18910 [Streptomyces sp. HU2014]|uniref:hypothetical protein n=1 Tax=Streptomyces sp. HU2014 TaxID=2939414 RepID=UPI00200C7685|nr:hypothetical protein [Streptomyces sp. HU2014]UQI46264.1 hypothetical protein M1P56_18910 [Streptomyces sp. HU2014]
MSPRRTHPADRSPHASLDHPRTRQAFRGAKLLVGSYAGLSLLTLVAIILLRKHHDIVTDAVRVRAGVVVATSLLMASFVTRAARGHSRSYLRLRLASGVMLVVIAAVIALPGAFPVWLKVEQGVCGVLLAGVVLIVNSKRVRSAFASR